MEMIDYVDANDQVIGSATKTDAIAIGHYARVAFVILLNARGELLLQQRKATKKTYPLYWSGSAAGHVQAGESYADAALRETVEELGVHAELTEVGKLTSEIDKEMVTLFIGESNGPFTVEEAAVARIEFYSLARLHAEVANLKMTAYLAAVTPMVEKYLQEKSVKHGN